MKQSQKLIIWIAAAIYAAALPTVASPKIKVNPKDGAQMILIPAGKFLMGSTKEHVDAVLTSDSSWQRVWFDNEQPQHSVYLDSFYIYKNLVTVAQYRRFCTATNRKMPDPPTWGWIDNHPVVNVTWDDAAAYAEWAGASLPTEAQWEKAARGTDGRTYPWGNTWDETRLQHSRNAYGDSGKTAPVGSFPTGASPYGVLDMAGNVWQWCADWYDEKYYQYSPSRNPTGPASGVTRVLRGGSWYSFGTRYFRTVKRVSVPAVPPGSGGFRCAVRGK